MGSFKNNMRVMLRDEGGGGIVRGGGFRKSGLSAIKFLRSGYHGEKRGVVCLVTHTHYESDFDSGGFHSKNFFKLCKHGSN